MLMERETVLMTDINALTGRRELHQAAPLRPDCNGMMDATPRSIEVDSVGTDDKKSMELMS